MKRRFFLSAIGFGTLGICLTGFSSCSFKLDLSKCIGLSESCVQNISGAIKVGNEQFAYYELESHHYTFDFGSSQFAHVYCENGRIAGFTVLLNESETSQEKTEALEKLYGKPVHTVSNEVGKEFHWKNAQRLISISYATHHDYLKQVFYTQKSIESSLIL